MQTQTLIAKNMDQETKNFIACIEGFGEDQSYFLINQDLLAFAMPELIGSKTFNGLESERRKNLFNQYLILSTVLECLETFEKENINEPSALVSTLKSFGETYSYSEINLDFLTLAMPELIGSNTFNSLSGIRKKELFNQYSTLKNVLNCLDEFIRDPQDNQNIIEPMYSIN